MMMAKIAPKAQRDKQLCHDKHWSGQKMGPHCSTSAGCRRSTFGAPDRECGSALPDLAITDQVSAPLSRTSYKLMRPDQRNAVSAAGVVEAIMKINCHSTSTCVPHEICLVRPGQRHSVRRFGVAFGPRTSGNPSAEIQKARVTPSRG